MVFNYDHFHFFSPLQTEGVGEGTEGGRSGGKLFQTVFLLEKILLLIIRAGEEKDTRRI